MSFRKIVCGLFVAAAFTVTGCSPGTGFAGSNGSDGGVNEGGLDASSSAPVMDGGADSSTGQSPSGELKIAGLTTTVATATGGAPLPIESAAVTFIAIVTDTRGLESIAGGQLMDATGHTYAAFGAGSTKGTFASTVDFATMNSVSPIDFAGTTSDRTFVAKFFDNAGNEASAQVKLGLACRSPLHTLVGACGGKCIDVNADGNNCGSCGKPCTSAQVCTNGACGTASVTGSYTSCLPGSAAGPLASCNAICSAAGRNCGYTGSYSYPADDPTCKVVPNGEGLCTNVITAPYFRCHCN